VDIEEDAQRILDKDLADNTGHWVCDGGDFEGTHAAVVKHVLDQIDFDDADYSKVKCWGAMEFDSPSHEAWLDGIHPMWAVVNRVSELYTDFVLESNGIKT
jgi:hypothetical protein